MSAPLADARGRLANATRISRDPSHAWFPPVSRREFWAVQALVLCIAGGHAFLETIGHTVEPRALYLLPASLYFVPVVYAALNFGLRGSLSTALWSAALTMPNILLWHTGLERLGEIWQTAIVVAVAVFVGQRVDHERHAREDAERREADRRASEVRFRGLFDNAAEAVLLVDGAGLIAEANRAAAGLLRRPLEDLKGSPLAALAGSDLTERLQRRAPPAVVALPGGSGGRQTWVEPIVCSPQVRPDGRVELQVILHDVTLQHQRQQDLEEYTRRVLAAREEEQRRIGRELHDGPLQSLVVVWRKLDELEDATEEWRRDAIAEARDLTEATADELRRISRALRPSVLDDLGLATALQSEATAVGRRSGIEVTFDRRGRERRLGPYAELLLLRIAQEALHNAERHAAATEIAVRLTYAAERVRLLVRDNGRGLEPIPSAAELLAQGKLGLVGMQERARLAGADFRARALPDGGTSIEVTVRA